MNITIERKEEDRHSAFMYQQLIINGKGVIISTSILENADEFLGKSIFSFIPERFKEEVFNCFIESKGGFVSKCELPADSDHNGFFYEYSFHPLRGENDKDVISLSIKKGHEEDSIHNRVALNYQNIFHHAHDAILIIDPDTENILEMNNKALEMYGYTREELRGFSLKKLSVNLDHGNLQKELLKKRGKINFETVQLNKNGSVLFLEVHASLITYNKKTCILSINRDLTKRKLAEKKINRSNEKLETIFDLVSDYTYSFIVDKNNIHLEWLSKSIRDDFSISDQNMNWEKLVYPKDRDRVKKAFQQLLTKKKITTEFRVINKYKKIKWIQNISKVIVGKDNKTLKIVGSAKNINKRKKAELALEESESMYRELFENTSDGIFIHDLQGNFLKVNQVACRQLGYDKKELVNMTVQNIDAPEFRKVAKKRIQELIVNQKLTFETAHRRKDGKIIPVELSSRLINYQNKVAILSTSRDITQRKLAEEKLNRELDINTAISFLSNDILSANFNIKKSLKDILSYLLEVTESNEGVIVETLPFSEEGFSTTYTDGFPLIYGSELNADKIIFPKKNGKYDSFWGYSLNKRKAFYSNHIINHEIVKGLNKQDIPLLNMLAVPAMVDEKLTGQIILLKREGEYSDNELEIVKRISRLMALALQKEQYLTELNTRNEELNNFVYKVSHDLRGPLSSIEGLINIIRLNKQDDTLKKYIELIHNRVRKLDDFIRDVLSHSRNINKKIDIGYINFKNIVDDCLDELSYLPGSDKLEKIIEVDGVDFYNDKIRIYEIFRNLLSNAIKYSDQNKKHPFIKIMIKCTFEYAHIEVLDNGTGIETKNKTSIFDMFYRGTEKSDGSGIGLYIVKQAVHKLDGTISVESELEKGTTFYLTIPNTNNKI